MRRRAWVAIGVAGLIAGACSYPDFEFRDEDSSSDSTTGTTVQGPSSSATGGDGGQAGDGAGGLGQGGGGTGPGSGGTAGDGGSGGGVVPVVPCGGSAPAVCSPGDVCCFDLTSNLDHCGNPGTCGDAAAFGNLRCNSSADCDGADLCCGTPFVTSPTVFFQETQCRSLCMAGELTVCDPTDVTTECPGGGACVSMSLSYEAYGHCP